jgi:hypothetical protein
VSGGVPGGPPDHLPLGRQAPHSLPGSWDRPRSTATGGGAGKTTDGAGRRPGGSGRWRRASRPGGLAFGKKASSATISAPVFLGE